MEDSSDDLSSASSGSEKVTVLMRSRDSSGGASAFSTCRMTSADGRSSTVRAAVGDGGMDKESEGKAVFLRDAFMIGSSLGEEAGGPSLVCRAPSAELGSTDVGSFVLIGAGAGVGACAGSGCGGGVELERRSWIRSIYGPFRLEPC